MIHELKADFQALADPERSATLQRFFKTGPGEYAEGDLFLGVTVPLTRKIAKKYRGLSHTDLQQLLHSPIHEHRLCALFILRHQYERAGEFAKEKFVDIYLKNTAAINNWDLVDSSAHYILGNHLRNHDKKILYRLARSKNLWERRIAIISTFAFINNNEFEDSLALAEILLHDQHDLIHKAVGWVLREIGKKSFETEEQFLQQHYTTMPRTMLRYAIEKFPEAKRQGYLKGTN